MVPGSPIKSFGDLVAKAKAEPNKISYSSVGVGTAMHLVTEWIQSEAGIQLNHIPFKGGTGPMTELLAGRLDVMVDTMTLTAKLVQEGRVRAIATTALPGKSPLNGVPAVSDTYPNMVYESWLGIIAPAGTPAAIIERLNSEIVAAVKSNDINDRLIREAVIPGGTTPDAFASHIKAEYERMGRVIREAKIVPAVTVGTAITANPAIPLIVRDATNRRSTGRRYAHKHSAREGMSVGKRASASMRAPAEEGALP